MSADSEHSKNQKRGRPLDSFLEGPVVVDGKLYLVDIPYGRIFRLDLASKEWTLLIQYDGEPNGLAWHPARQELIIADFKNGILGLDIKSCKIRTIMSRFNGERLKGPNDLIVAKDGSIFFTDQGMTGLQDPSGRVYRIHENGQTNVLLSNCPSPNGLVLDQDQTSLFVAMTRDNAVWHVPLYPDGTAQRTGRFSSYYGIGGPDGLALDADSNLFVAHSSLGTVFVHRPNGEPLARLASCRENGITNLTWDSTHSSILYVVESASGSILTWHAEGIESESAA